MFVARRALTQEHGTPPHLLRWAEQRYGPFDLDPAGDIDLNCAPEYYTWEGLIRPWHGRVFVNPPYSGLRKWVKKASQEHEAGNTRVICMLAKVDTSTSWFQDLVWPTARVFFIRRRVRYLSRQWEPAGRGGGVVSCGFEPGGSAPFASAFFVWSNDLFRWSDIIDVDARGEK